MKLFTRAILIAALNAITTMMINRPVEEPESLIPSVIPIQLVVLTESIRRTRRLIDIRMSAGVQEA